MQLQGNPFIVWQTDCLRDFVNVKKHDDALGDRVQFATDLVRNRHDNERRLLSRAYVVEFQTLTEDSDGGNGCMVPGAIVDRGRWMRKGFPM